MMKVVRMDLSDVFTKLVVVVVLAVAFIVVVMGAWIDATGRKVPAGIQKHTRTPATRREKVDDCLSGTYKVE